MTAVRTNSPLCLLRKQKMNTREAPTSILSFCNVSALKRLLCIGHDVLGKTAVRLLQGARNYWHSKCPADNSQQESGPQDAGYQPRKVELACPTFAECVQSKGWIQKPPQCKEWVETLPVHTLNFATEFPPEEHLELCVVARMFGFEHAQDVDCKGKHFFHHMFTAMTYCRIFGYVALHGFRTNSDPLPGDLRQAISHTRATKEPNGWTSLHILCT